MSQPITVRVRDIIGSPLCVSAEDGQILHDKIAPLVRDDVHVVLSFRGVDTVISAFLNAAIGQLYGEFSEDRVRGLLSFEDVTDDDLTLVKRVAENAVIYFKNAAQFDRAWEEEFEGGAHEEDE